MKEATADKKVLLYLTALGIVNTSISAIGLKESAKKSSKYSFNPEDIEKKWYLEKYDEETEKSKLIEIKDTSWIETCISDYENSGGKDTV